MVSSVASSITMDQFASSGSATTLAQCSANVSTPSSRAARSAW